MKNGFTGGQYSMVRAVFGVYLLIHFAMLLPHGAELVLFPMTALLVVALGAAVLFTIGLYDRVAAIVLWYLLVCLFGGNPLIANPSLPYVGWLLLLHAVLPPAPFGSWAARRRVDPRGGWSFPPPLYAAAWIGMAAGYSYSGFTKLVSPSWVDGTAVAALALELLYLPLAFVRRARPLIWTAMLLMHLGLMLLSGFADLRFGMVVLHLFTFDPAWIPRRWPERNDAVFYDGTCGLCHRSVRLLLAEDASGTAFTFAALDSDRFREVFPDPREMPDSVVVHTEAGETFVRSDAPIYICHRLGGFWRALGFLFSLVPRRLRDAGYDFVARIRYRIFGRAKDACPLLPPDLRSRFSA